MLTRSNLTANLAVGSISLSLMLLLAMGLVNASTTHREIHDDLIVNRSVDMQHFEELQDRLEHIQRRLIVIEAQVSPCYQNSKIADN
jgi:hypothetical protein